MDFNHGNQDKMFCRVIYLWHHFVKVPDVGLCFLENRQLKPHKAESIFWDPISENF